MPLKSPKDAKGLLENLFGWSSAMWASRVLLCGISILRPVHVCLFWQYQMTLTKALSALGSICTIWFRNPRNTAGPKKHLMKACESLEGLISRERQKDSGSWRAPWWRDVDRCQLPAGCKEHLQANGQSVTTRKQA